MLCICSSRFLHFFVAIFAPIVQIMSSQSLISPRELFVQRLQRISIATAVGTSAVVLRSTLQETTIYEELHRRLFESTIAEGDKVLEIGFGEGANTNLYPQRAFNIIGLDKRLDSQVTRPKAPLNYQGLVQGVVEHLPFPDESFDVVVGTLVLCSVQDPEQAVTEVARVLRKGGRFVSFEHVLGEPGSFLRKQHEILDPMQQTLADGCHLTRATDSLLHNSVPVLFSNMLESHYLSLDSQWPISRQFACVLVK